MEYNNNAEGRRTDVEKYSRMAALSYVFLPVAIMMLVIDKNSNYVRHHLNQVCCLWLWFTACSVACIVPVIGWLAGGVGMVAGVVFAIIAIVRALKGEYYQIPIVGKYRIVPEA